MLKTDSNLCSICDHITCSKCLQPYNKDIKDHSCNEDDIKTAKLLKKDTKYCPKCNFGITKISGLKNSISEYFFLKFCLQFHVITLMF